MKKIILSALGVMALCFSGSALEIAVTPGSLSASKLTINNTRDSQLKLTGSASAADLELLKFISPSIKDLDLSALSLPGGILPDMMLIGSNVETVTLPEDLKSIGTSAFASSAIKQILVPQSVTKIGDRAFAACPNLAKVVIQGNPTLGTGLFKDDANLTEVNFGADITEVPDRTFENCSKYAQPVPAEVSKIGAYAYCGTALTSVNLTRVSEVGDFAFANCAELVELDIDHEHEMTVGKGAFFADASIEVLPFLYGFYPSLVMSGTAGTVDLDLNGESVEEGAFANNNTVKTLRLGADVKSIKAHAFRNMGSLETVNVNPLGINIPETDDLAFSGLENAEGRYDILLHVKEKTADVWREHPVWRLFNIVDGGADVGSVTDSELASVGVTRDGGNVYVKSNGVIDSVAIYSLDGKTLWQGSPSADSAHVDSLPEDEVLIVKVVSQGAIKVVKLK